MMGMVAEQLAEIARVYNTTLFRAEALKAEGAQALLEGDDSRAASRLAASVRLWNEVHLMRPRRPGRCCREPFTLAGDEPAARAELAASLAAFDAMGASHESARSTALVQPEARRLDNCYARVHVHRHRWPRPQSSKPSVMSAWTGLIAWHDRTLRGAFARHGGEELSLTPGDGFCA